MPYLVVWEYTNLSPETTLRLLQNPHVRAIEKTSPHSFHITMQGAQFGPPPIPSEPAGHHLVFTSGNLSVELNNAFLQRGLEELEPPQNEILPSSLRNVDSPLLYVPTWLPHQDPMDDPPHGYIPPNTIVNITHTQNEIISFQLGPSQLGPSQRISFLELSNPPEQPQPQPENPRFFATTNAPTTIWTHNSTINVNENTRLEVTPNSDPTNTEVTINNHVTLPDGTTGTVNLNFLSYIWAEPTTLPPSRYQRIST